MSLSDGLLVGVIFDRPRDHFGAILVFWAVRASIWTTRGPEVPKKGVSGRFEESQLPKGSAKRKQYLDVLGMRASFFSTFFRCMLFGRVFVAISMAKKLLNE